MIDIRFVAIGNNELGEPTEVIECRRCGAQHPVEYGTSKTLLQDNTWSDPVPSTLGFYKCGDGLFLGTVEGKAFGARGKT